MPPVLPRLFTASLVLLLSACTPAVFERVPIGDSEPLSGVPVARARGDVLRVDHEGFTVWLDCERHGALRFEYRARSDTDSLPRKNSFALDPDVPKACQQRSGAAYGRGYDRGHLVPANHLDHSAAAIAQSNYMTNILPQVAQMNRGAWLRTEEIVECYRDIDELRVIGGVIWGDDPADDYFVASHGVKTPDAFWKAVIRGHGSEEAVIAWLIPNTAAASKASLDRYLVSVAELEARTGDILPVPDSIRKARADASWPLPPRCDRG